MVRNIPGSFPNEPSQMDPSPKQRKSTFTMSPNAGSPKFSLPVYGNELGRLPLQAFDAQAHNSQPHHRENHWHGMPHSVRTEGGERLEPTHFAGPSEASSSYELRHSGASAPPFQQHQEHPPRPHHTFQSIPTHGFSSTSMEQTPYSLDPSEMAVSVSMKQSPYSVDPSEMAVSMSFESTLSHTQLSRTSIGSNSMVAPLPSSGGSSMENVYSGMTEGSDPIFPPRHSTYFQQQEVPRQGDPFSDMAAIWSKASSALLVFFFVVDVLTWPFVDWISGVLTLRKWCKMGTAILLADHPSSFPPSPSISLFIYSWSFLPLPIAGSNYLFSYESSLRWKMPRRLAT